MDCTTVKNLSPSAVKTYFMLAEFDLGDGVLRSAPRGFPRLRGSACSLGRVTVAELAHGWLSRKKEYTAPSYYRMLESAWRVHVEPRWGKAAVADIDRLGVEAWLASMGAKGAGATTILRAHGAIGILADAVKAKKAVGKSGQGRRESTEEDGQASRLPVR